MFMHVLGFIALFISYCSTSCELCIFLKCRITCRLAVGPVCVQLIFKHDCLVPRMCTTHLNLHFIVTNVKKAVTPTYTLSLMSVFVLHVQLCRCCRLMGHKRLVRSARSGPVWLRSILLMPTTLEFNVNYVT